MVEGADTEAEDQEKEIVNIQGKYSWLKHMDFAFIDLLAMIAAFSLSYLLKFGTIAWWGQDQWGLLLLFLCLVDFVITLLMNPYSGTLKRLFHVDLIRYFLLTIYNVAIACFFFYLLKVGANFSREMLFLMYGIYFVLGVLLKYIWKKILCKTNQKKSTPIFVVCPAGREEEVAHYLSAMDIQKYDVVGTADRDGFVGELLRKNATEVLIAVDPGNISEETYAQLMSNGVRIHINIESMLGFQTENQFVSKIGVYKTLGIDVFSFSVHQIFYLWLKRGFDIFCGVLGLILLIPLSVVVKIANLCSGDTKRIYYTQKRVGLNGRPIRIYKFRSMVPNADEVLKELLKDDSYRAEWEANQKFEHDPRITKIGGFLRTTSLDEIPQLINVLKGDMSLVGPRPLVEGELEAHDGLKLYQRVKPGITGWWGCNGRSNLDYRERLELEYYYVKNCSLYLDVLCIVKTVLAVLKRDGSV